MGRFGDIIAYIAAGAFLATALGFVGLASRQEQTAEEMWERNKELLGEGIKKSAGTDRIWSVDEKREFLDKVGLDKVVLQGSSDIYFRRTEGGNIEVIEGYNLERSRYGFSGSDTKSGKSIGVLSPEKLEKYLQE